MADDLEIRIAEQVLDVALGAGVEVIHADHFIAGVQEDFAEMRAQKTRAASDQNPFAREIDLHQILPDTVYSVCRASAGQIEDRAGRKRTIVRA